jgi:undecaprenyl-diphosphatase
MLIVVLIVSVAPAIVSAASAAHTPDLNLLQVIVLSILQGVAELFPISSLGHTVILPALLHWNIDQKSPSFLAFVVLLHFGTAAALLLFYWRDWVRLLRILFTSLARGKFSDDPDERFIWLIIIGTIPAAVLALLLEKPLRVNFGNPRAAAALLAVNGVLMLGGEALRRRQGSSSVGVVDKAQEYKDVDKLGWRGAIIVGLCQSLALLPGISRSGATMVGGLALGLRHHEAARYTFMLATPIIVAASIKTAPDLLAPAGRGVLGYAVLGCLLSGIAAYLSVRFLDRYFRTNRLDPFAYYCLAAGIGAVALLSAGA